EGPPNPYESSSPVARVVDAAAGSDHSEEQPAPETLPATKQLWFINWDPTEKQQEYIDRMVASGDFSSRVEVVSFALDLMMIDSMTIALAAKLEIQNPGLGTHCSGKTGIYTSAE